MTAPAYATHPDDDPTRPLAILPGPHATPATISTALLVLTAATENIVRIDIEALQVLMDAYEVTVPSEVEQMVAAAATYRGQLTGALPLAQAQLDRIHAWLLVNAPDRIVAGATLADTVIGLLAANISPPPARRTAPARTLSPPPTPPRRRTGTSHRGPRALPPANG